MRVNYDLTNYVENNSPDLWNELVSSGKKSDAVIKKPLKTKSTDEGEVHMTEQEKPNHISGRHSQLGSSSDNDKKNSIKRFSFMAIFLFNLYLGLVIYCFCFFLGLIHSPPEKGPEMFNCVNQQ